MAAVATTGDARTDGVGYFDPEYHLIDIVRRAMANRQDVAITLDGVGGIELFSNRGEYFANVSDMAAFCTVPSRRFRVTVLEDDRPAAPAADKIGRNIDELMWQAAFFASEGRLMKGCFRDDVVQLRHWPNLSRLPRTPNSIRISAFLTRYPTSITLASRLLKIDSAELYQFYSAARCAGIAHALNRKPEEPVLKPHRNQTLLSMLLGKIANL
jgi:hypothetical protein